MSRVDQDNSLINLSGPENISNITTFLLMPLLNNQLVHQLPHQLEH